ncbi:uncharacterized protein A1O9_12589 [Exophiala aquamarina CBS 119918]|uniref:Enoyl reductase (ER) domain-containing protein n=1 Tax=Exophiala aquamarina CBS 119918 TaxID=1182545 RepID=A0A072P764_9EURO|nr:uncharacterized protein A1O9_12589 [Exophiala aquamarina CBS 119918]KEF51440.1 hypothetical protein A1O9_12589 [Exophiala aquamarina CBS 119918]
MRALRFHGRRDVRLDEIPQPELRPGWVKVKNVWGGICGSDKDGLTHVAHFHEYLFGPRTTPSEPHPLTGESVPTILGHEFSGRVIELSPEVCDLEIGQKVVIFPVIGDGDCHYCQEELFGLCDKWGFLGYSGYGGGFAEYICVDRKQLFKVPDSVPLDVAALVEPLAVAWHGIKLARLAPSDSALVVGAGRTRNRRPTEQAWLMIAGPIGIATVMCLKAIGVGNIIVSEVSQGRSRHALKAGAHQVISQPDQDVVALSRQNSSDGRGPHVVFDAAGVQASINVAFASVRGRGTIVNLALFDKPVVLDISSFNRKSIQYLTSSLYTRAEFQEVIDAIASGRIERPESMITGRISLAEATSQGLERLLQSKDEHIKILVSPDVQPNRPKL